MLDGFKTAQIIYLAFCAARFSDFFYTVMCEKVLRIYQLFTCAVHYIYQVKGRVTSIYLSLITPKGKLQVIVSIQGLTTTELTGWLSLLCGGKQLLAT